MKVNHKVLLVLANGIDKDGVLSDDCRQTVNLALTHFNMSRYDFMIMSGHVSYKADFIPAVSEAQAMKDYAASKGVEAARILTECESRDTFGNAYFSRVNLLDPLQIENVTIVSGPNHSHERLDYIFGKVFGAAIKYDLVTHSLTRLEQHERERQSLQKLQNLFDTIQNGDIKQLYKVMRLRHPAYRTGQQIN